MKRFKKGKAVILVSTGQAARGERENAAAFELACQYLDRNHVPYAVGNGSWDGVEEPVLAIQYGYSEYAIELARINKQECILYVDGERVASLGTADDGYRDAENVIGILRNVPEWEARQHSAWTELGGQYYYVES